MRNVATIGLVFGMGLLGSGCQVDMNIGDWIKLTGSGTGHGNSGSAGSSSGSAGSAGEAGGPPAAGCVDQEQGSSTSCEEVATWKQYASADCESSGGLLETYAPREECGKGLFRFVDYTCCPNPEPPPPLPAECTSQVQGSDTSCKDAATWKQYAADDCQSSGGQLANYLTRESCGKGLFRFVDYTCCPNPEPPPDPVPTDCTALVQGSDTSCKDVATWKQYASNDCESSGGVLADYSTREECGKGLFRFVDYTCCPQPEPPPDPVPTDCTSQVQGSDTSCKDVATWKQYASSDCVSSGGVLADYSTREECGKGLFRFVDYTCCPKPEPQPPLPNDCKKLVQGSDTSCKDIGTWKQYAGDDCVSSGGMLTDYWTREECGEGLFRFVDYCCSN